MANKSATSPLLNELQLRRLQAALGPTLEVRGLLGSGGFADVYAVWDRRLKRELAVKTLRSDIVISEALLQRFQREAEAMAQLRHPSIIPIYNVGEDAGIAYFTMPRIEGKSLAAVLATEGVLSVPETIRILLDCSSALATAHRAGIVHRDIKPENIMLEGPDRRAVVMDFGISKSITDDVKLTGTGAAMGTPDYMSPEQAMGERAIDHRADQYSLAVVAFRMLTGRLPFQGDSVQTLIFKQVTEVAPPVQNLNPSVPTPIADAIARALAKDPAARFPNMEGFAAALAYGSDTVGIAGGTVRRQELDFQARIAVMRKLLEPAKWIIAAGVMALVTGLIAHDRTFSPGARALAGERAEAAFVAKSFVASRGGSIGARMIDSEHDTAFAFMRAAVGRDSADRLALLVPPEHYWDVTFYPAGGGWLRNRWTVSVGQGGKIVGYEHVRPDTARGDTLSRAAAYALAEREMRERGWDPTQLRALPDSTLNRPARRDWVFMWQRPLPAVVMNTDSARARISVGIRGSDVGKYSAMWSTPPGFRPATSKSVVLSIGWLFAALLGTLGVSALVWAMRRQRVDVLRWNTAIRIAGLGCGAFVAFLFYPEFLTAAFGNNPEKGGAITAGVIMIVIAGGWFLLLVALVESFASERRPTLVAGMNDAAAGKVRIPEAAVAAVYGIAGGLVIVAVNQILQVIKLELTPTAYKGFETALEFSFPTMSTIGSLPLILLFPTAIAFVVLALERWRVPRPLALAAPAVLYAGIQVGFAKAPVWTVASALLTAGLLTLVVWRSGWLSGVIATLVFTQLPSIVSTLRFGGDDVRLSALLSLAIVSAPLFIGVSARRRFAQPKPERDWSST